MHKALIRTEKIILDNSPAMCTGLGIVGVIVTAGLAGQAAYKAALIIDVDESRGGTHGDMFPRFKERSKLTWKLYLPATVSGALTVASIVGANKISSRRAAAVAVAYSLSEHAFSEYKDKIIEKLGDKKERSFRDEIAQNRIDGYPPCEIDVILTGDGDVLCFDSLTGRYFKSAMESLRKAQNDVNQIIIHDGYCSLTEFYNSVGLSQTVYSEEVGWTQDKLLELSFSTTMSDNNRPCIVLNYNYSPIRHYHRLQ